MRQRKAVLSAMSVSFISVALMLFLIEDETSFLLQAPPGYAKNDKTAGAAIDFNQGDEVSGASGSNAQKALARAEKARSRYFKDCPDCPDMVLIPAGEVNIGSPLFEAGRGIGEEPVTQLAIGAPFAVGRTEVTVLDFRRFVEDAGYEPKGVCSEIVGKRIHTFRWDQPERRWVQKDDEELPGIERAVLERHPVTCITLGDAQAYMRWLSQKTGKTYSLPSQARWEYMARAGSPYPYAYGATIDETQATYGRKRKLATPVAWYPPNDFGIYDVHGNAWEMTADCWSPDLSVIPGNADPVGAIGDCTRRVIKGGGWDSEVDKLRSASRAVLPEDEAMVSVGFRLYRRVDKAEDIMQRLSGDEQGLEAGDKAAAVVVPDITPKTETTDEKAAQ